MDLQPLIDAGAALLGSTLVLVLLALTWIVALFGRSRVAGWLEALGWNGIVGMVANLWAACRGYPIQPLNGTVLDVQPSVRVIEPLPPSRAVVPAAEAKETT